MYHFRQRRAGRKKVKRRESKLYREIQGLKESLKQQKRKTDKYRKRCARLQQDSESPRSKTQHLLGRIPVSREVHKTLVFHHALLDNMVNGLHLYSAFIQSALQFLPLIHPFTHTFTHQRQLAAMQGTNQLVRSNWGLGVLLRDTSTHPGWDRTGNPPTARRQLYLLSHIAP